MTAEQPSVEALDGPGILRAALTFHHRRDLIPYLDSLTAALERAERENELTRANTGNLGHALYGATVRAEAAEARAQKAEAVVEAARRLRDATDNAERSAMFGDLYNALTAYDEPEQA